MFVELPASSSAPAPAPGGSAPKGRATVTVDEQPGAVPRMRVGNGPARAYDPASAYAEKRASNHGQEKSSSSSSSSSRSSKKGKRRQRPFVTLAIHGGAGGTITPDIPPALQAAYRARLRAALEAGYAVLEQGLPKGEGRSADAGTDDGSDCASDTDSGDQDDENEAAYAARDAGNALDAVCAAVKVLEDSPLFNAGRGAVFTRDGTVECEASVMLSLPRGRGKDAKEKGSGLPATMHGNEWFERGCPPDAALPTPLSEKAVLAGSGGDGPEDTFDTRQIPSTRRCAAATLVRGTRNPILLARTLFLSPDAAPHVLLSGAGAEAVGAARGCRQVRNSYYYTRRRWLEHRRGLGLPDDDDEDDGDDGGDGGRIVHHGQKGSHTYGHGKSASLSFEDALLVHELSPSRPSASGGAFQPGVSVPAPPVPAHLAPPPSYTSAMAAGPSRASTAAANARALDPSSPAWLAAQQHQNLQPSIPSAAPSSSRSSAPSSYYDRTPSLSAASGSASSTSASSSGRARPSSLASWTSLGAGAADVEGHAEQEHDDDAIFAAFVSSGFDPRTLPQGTVGACAIDARGRLAAATSTGGKTNKNTGRIGDTPSVGAGFWAERFVPEAKVKEQTIDEEEDSEQAGGEHEDSTSQSLLSALFSCLSCTRGRKSAADDAEVQRKKKNKKHSKQHGAEKGLAVSGTGDGDYFLRVSFASLLAHRMRFLGESARTAGESAIDELDKNGGAGGAIVLDHNGKVTFPMNSATMNRGYMSSLDGAKPRVALFRHDKLE